LNLFLELLARRSDGYHEIDTIMVPVSWCDRLRLRFRETRGVDLSVCWLPSPRTYSRRLGVSVERLDVPEGESNLVHRALSQFIETFDIRHGFICELQKSIPAGAGMGGASSDAAAVLLCAARLCGVSTASSDLTAIAAGLGSDVPFFLGLGKEPAFALRARGRGEHLQTLRLTARLHMVVVFPNRSLSTATVYAASKVPQVPQSAEPMIQALESGSVAAIGSALANRLSEPARKIAPRIDEIFDSMWQAGLRTCQLTGSGAACFALVPTVRDAERAAARLRARLEPGALVVPVSTTSLPPAIEIR
jgi:4-diphosphocytidyl-2-C-methyl-D-erythritol kinase